MNRFYKSIASAIIVLLLICSITPTVSAANNNNVTDTGTQINSGFISVNETVSTSDGIYQLIMTGLKQENKERIINELSDHFSPGGEISLKITDDAIPDAEKWDLSNISPNGYDALHCWAASAANMLWISGWANGYVNPRTGQPYASEDEIFSFFNDSFSNRGGEVDRGIDWFFTGEYFLSGANGGADLLNKKNPEYGYKKDFVSSLAQKEYVLYKNPSHISVLENLDRESPSPSVCQAEIGSFTGDGAIYGAGHSVTVAGVMIDPEKNLFTERYRAIAIIDSDNDAFLTPQEAQIENPTVEQKLAGKAARPNSVTFYPLRYNVDSEGTPFWEIVDYIKDETTYLYNINTLALPDEELIARCTEKEGTCSIVDTADFSIDTLFATRNNKPTQSIFDYHPDNDDCTVFVEGETINLNYFISNRSYIEFTEENADGKNCEIGWQVSDDNDKVIAEGTDIFPFPIFAGVEQGTMIRLNTEDGQILRWKPGDYTVTLNLNPQHSFKEAYYLNNNVEPCHFTILPAILGDADLNGTIDIADATTIQFYGVRMIELNDTAKKLADVDNDGNVSIVDATWIQHYLVNMKAPQGIGDVTG